MKLRVRDAVLDRAEPWLEAASTQEEALDILAAHLPELAQAGAEVVGEGVPVTASIAQDAWFPTKEYEDFALPAGKYCLAYYIGGGRRAKLVVCGVPSAVSGLGE